MSRSETKTWSGAHGSGSGWKCDTCGQKIKNAGEGWLEWIGRYDDLSESIINRDIHIVHHALYSPYKDTGGDCFFNKKVEFKRDKSTPAGSHLDTFLGNDGLTQLLEMLGDDFQPRDKLLEIIMRLHVDNYEQAYLFLERAVSEGVVEPNMRKGFHWQEDLRTVAKEFQTQPED